MNLICTRSDDNIKEMCELTHPFIKNYARKCNSDFKILSGNCSVSKHYRIMELYSLLFIYDRIIQIDSDTIIMLDCPNLFTIVPDNTIGSIYEDKGSRTADRRSRIDKVQAKFGTVNWTEGYINTGVFVVSKAHQKIFMPINGEYWNDLGFDDILLGYNIHACGYTIHELPFQFNHMSVHSENWNENADRFKSHIIHYAGQGIFEKDKYQNRLEQIKSDIQIINRS